MSPSTDLLIQMARLGLDGQTVLIVSPALIPCLLRPKHPADQAQTGGSGGIGAALADLFYRSGCKVIITGTSQAKLDKVLPEAEGGRVLRYECDIRDHGAVEGVVKRISQDGHTVDVLINNVCKARLTPGGKLTLMQAGYALNATCPLWEQDVQDLDAVLDVDLKGLIYMTRTYTVL
jgi:NAD(P)-dependent dehydrogenase (short-subunit alcohol dehydrogenase family)